MWIWVLRRLQVPKWERFRDGKRQLLEVSMHHRLTGLGDGIEENDTINFNCWVHHCIICIFVWS